MKINYYEALGKIRLSIAEIEDLPKFSENSFCSLLEAALVSIKYVLLNLKKERLSDCLEESLNDAMLRFKENCTLMGVDTSSSDFRRVLQRYHEFFYLLITRTGDVAKKLSVL